MTHTHALKSVFLIIIQFGCLLVIFLTSPIVSKNIIGALLQMIGAWLGVWAVWRMQPGNFNIKPEVKEGARLVTSGPYAIIRHPMYLALLLLVTPLIFSYPSWWRFAVWGVFVINMIAKLLYEEKLLQNVFPDYITYMERTKRLIPFIW